MLILGIESSAGPASAAVVQDGHLLGEFFMNTKQTHSQTLLPMVESLLVDLGLSCKDLDCIAVANGPGSFTGVRIGVSCVKGLALPHDTVCCGISTLEGIAYGGVGLTGSIICAAMDARCGQVYNALFEVTPAGLNRLTEDRAIFIEDLGRECQGYGGRLVLFGDGAAICHKEFATWGARIAPEAIRFQRASSVALLAQERQWVTSGELLPTYLRMPQAERELKAKQKNREDINETSSRL